MQLKHLENKLEWHLVHIRFRVQLIPIWHKLKPAQLDHIGNSEDFLVFSVEAEGRLPHEVSHRWFESFMNNVDKVPHWTIRWYLETRRTRHADLDTQIRTHTHISTRKLGRIKTGRYSQTCWPSLLDIFYISAPCQIAKCVIFSCCTCTHLHLYKYRAALF